MTEVRLYDSDVDRLTEWITNRDTTPADVIEILIDRYLDELDREWPKSERSDERCARMSEEEIKSIVVVRKDFPEPKR